MVAGLLSALAAFGSGGHGTAFRREIAVVALDARNLRIEAPAPIGAVRIAGLRENFDFMVMPADRPAAARVRILTGRSPLRLEALPLSGGLPLGSATVANPRG